MAQLSPQAQAVLDAFLVGWQDEPMVQDRQCLAAALRAAVKLTKKQKVMKTLGIIMAKSEGYCLESDLLAIAEELEAS